MPLFEVAIIEKPSKKEIEEGTGAEKLVFGPKCVIAADTQTAGMRAIMKDPEAAKIDMDKAEVLVRPFVM